MRKASAVLLFVLLFSLLALPLNIGVVLAYYFDFNIAVAPESPSTHDTVQVTISFGTNYIYENPANFSTLSQNGNNFSVVIEIYPWPDMLPVCGDEEETYNLGNLCVGLCCFNVDVQVWSGLPGDVFRSLLDSASYHAFFTVETLPITVPDDYLTIQEAINAASDGDTIFVRNGTYYENVIVNKSLSIVGEGEGITTIDGSGSGTVFEVFHTSNASLRNFAVRNGKIGLAITEVRCTQMRNITMTGSQYNFRFIEASEPVRSYPDIDTSNTVEGAPIYFWMNQHNRTIADDAGFVALRNCSGITLRNLNLSNNGNGIYAVVVSGLLVENVTTSNTIQGLSLYAVTDSVIRNSVIEHNRLGIAFSRCDRNAIVNSLISNNDCGIVLDQSRYNTVERNQIVWSNQNWLSAGLRLSYTSYNTIRENMIANNERGIVYSESYNNSIFHNNFEMNNMQISDQGVVHYPNFWDDGCEGNYWSNYNGTDLDGDGIGDTYLPWEGVDQYPLMNLYWNPGDIDHDLDVDIFDVVKCGIAYGSTTPDPNWNPHCDIAEPYGIIDIFDIVMIATSYGEEYTP